MALVHPVFPERQASLCGPVRALVGLLLAAVMTGCTIAPGIDVGADPDPAVWTPSGEDEADFIPKVQPINADVLVAQQQARREARAAVEHAARTDLVADYEYRIGASDVINIVVWGHPELSNPLGLTQDIEQQARLVSRNGTIFYPHVGLLPVAGKTVDEIREQLAELLEPYVTDPQVDVRVVEYRSQKVYVTGEVTQPGTLTLTDEPMTLLDAINQAGGFNELADRRRAVLTRDGEQRSIDLQTLYSSGKGDLLLRDRDVVHVPGNQFNRVFVMGEITRQTALPMRENGRMTLAEAISEADGLDLNTADTSNIFVLRGQPVFDDEGKIRGVRPEAYHLDARSGLALVLAEGFELQPRDIVYAASSGVVRFNRVIGHILPTVQTLWQIQRIITD